MPENLVQGTPPEASWHDSTEALAVEISRANEMEGTHETPRKIATILSIRTPDGGYLCRVQRSATVTTPREETGIANEADKSSALPIVVPIFSLKELGEDSANPYIQAGEVVTEFQKKYDLLGDAVSIMTDAAEIYLSEADHTPNGLGDTTYTTKCLPAFVYRVEFEDPTAVQRLLDSGDFTVLYDSSVGNVLPESGIKKLRSTLGSIPKRTSSKPTEPPIPTSETSSASWVTPEQNTDQIDAETLTLITVAGEQIPAVIHPDCELVIPEAPLNIKIDGRESEEEVEHHLENLIRRVESLEKSDERLTLAHIKKIVSLIPDRELALQLKRAYLRERGLIIGLQQLLVPVLEGGALQTVMHNSDAWNFIALAGIFGTKIGAKYASEEHLGVHANGKDGNAHTSYADKSFENLLSMALISMGESYNVAKAPGFSDAPEINSIAVFNAFAHRFSVDFSDVSALNSRFAERWFPLLPHAGALFVNQRYAEAAAYAGITQQ
ncbi:hypothetical protein H6764_00230 [Candidatus Nomurabacteria bacterium]|nr:hypothetical protein [Candidatus Nomurabacteria bacterium]